MKKRERMKRQIKGIGTDEREKMKRCKKCERMDMYESGIGREHIS